MSLVSPFPSWSPSVPLFLEVQTGMFCYSQEFAHHNRSIKDIVDDGHMVFASSFKKGQRRMAIIVHEKCVQYIVPN